jgi:hypothetical protein
MISTSIALVATLAVIFAARRWGWGWSAPMILYAVVWTAAVAIHAVRFFPFYDVSARTWVVVALAFASFVGAGFAGGRYGRRRPGVPVTASDSGGIVLVMRVYFLVGLVGVVIFWWQVHQLLGIDAMVSRPIDVHNALSDRTIGSSHLFLYYLGVAAAVIYGFLVMHARHRLRAVDTALLVLFLAAMSVSTERNHLLWVLVTWTFLVAAPPRFDARLLPLAIVVVVVAVLAVGFYVGAGQWLGKSPGNLAGALIVEAGLSDPATDPAVAERLRRPGYAPDPAIDLPADSRLHAILPGGPLYQLANLYMSLAAVLPSLDQGLRHHEPSYGQLTFRPIFRALSRLHLIPDTMRLTTYDEVRTPYPANAYSYLYEHCRDFGLPGAVVFPGLFGLLAGYSYMRLSQAPGSLWAVWLAMLQGMVLWSPFQNRFVLTVSAYVVGALVLAFLVAPRLGLARPRFGASRA